ncbi:MAG TPA: redoxin domain-containing protein [Pyrinomonadaceae bacterium]|jgi:thiol-disulfide isomerase/thioredoxin|nr:redoxin domain-containing protein [Pyrinomonadaceae bacterium]
MHRHNTLATGLLVVVLLAILTAGYASGRGPLGVVSYAVTRLRDAGGQGAVVVSENSATAAPEFAVGDWINSDPLTLKNLRGRVVLVDFWTFGCFNCRNTLPSLKQWDARYREQGLTVVGVHSPEFDEEKNVQNVRREVAELGIKYPVVTDNDYANWRAYDVSAWPTIFVLDKSGRVRWTHVGEGAYDKTEQVIQKLLAEEDK